MRKLAYGIVILLVLAGAVFLSLRMNPAERTPTSAPVAATTPAATPPAQQAAPAGRPEQQAALVPPPPVITQQTTPTDDDILLLETPYGTVEIETFPQLAPNHVARIKELAREKFYDGLLFHRVIAGFMAQTGDPRGNGTGGSGKNINAEFNEGKHIRGAVSMARSQNPNSADSQFFIVLADSQFLDRNYTVWGRVIRGMEFIDSIRRGDPNRNGEVGDPDKIVTMRVKGDVEGAAARPN